MEQHKDSLRKANLNQLLLVGEKVRHKTSNSVLKQS